MFMPFSEYKSLLGRERREKHKTIKQNNAKSKTKKMRKKTSCFPPTRTFSKYNNNNHIITPFETLFFIIEKKNCLFFSLFLKKKSVICYE